MDKEELIFEIKKGLTSSPKYIPTWYRYDKEGSEICNKFLTDDTPYYFHDAEVEVLKDHSQDMLNDLPTPCTLIDLGSGSGIKTKYLIDAFLEQQGSLHYVPVDISEEFLMETCKTISSEYGDELTITPIVGIYESGIQKMRDLESTKFIVWFGSLQSCPYQRQIKYLESFREYMTEQDRLLISVDTTEDQSNVKAAYFDPLSQQFYLHAINRLNEEFQGNIDIDCFQLESDFVLQKSEEVTSYHRVWLRSLKNQCYFIGALDLNIEFTENERWYLHEGEGNSCKYSKTQVEYLVRKSKLCVHKSWTDKAKHVLFACLKRSD